MRIALVTQTITHIKGGAERVFIETANLLTAMGHEIEIILFEPNNTAPPFPLDKSVKITNLFPVQTTKKFSAAGKSGSQKIRLKNIIKRVPNVLGLSYLKWRFTHGIFSRKLNRHIEHSKPDLVCAFLPTAIATAAYVYEQQKIPHIASLQSRPDRDIYDEKRWDNNPIFRKMFSKGLQTASRITILQEEFIMELPKNLRRKSIVIPNVVHTICSEKITDIRSREKIVVSIGRLVESKGFIDLINSWADARIYETGWQLVIYGDGPEYPKLISHCQNLSIQDSVQIRPSTDNLQDVYNNAKLLAHPSQYEGFGLVVAEALTYGVPCIAFEDCTGVNKLIKNGENGILVSADKGLKRSQVFGSELRKLALNEEQQLAFSKAGTSSMKKYSSKNISIHWSKMLNNIHG